MPSARHYSINRSHYHYQPQQLTAAVTDDMTGRETTDDGDKAAIDVVTACQSAVHATRAVDNIRSIQSN